MSSHCCRPHRYRRHRRLLHHLNQSLGSGTSGWSDSSEEERSRKRRHCKENGKQRSKVIIKKAKGKPKWKSPAFRSQFHENKHVDKAFRTALACRNLPRKAKVSIAKVHKSLLKRQRWLAVADDHGVAAVNRFGVQWSASKT